MLTDTRKLVAEALGTWILVFVGAGAVIVESHTGLSHALRPEGKLSLIGVAQAHGFVLTGSIFALGAISGAHFNPAVSLAMWLRGRLRSAELVGYVAVQLAAAFAAALCLAAIFPDEVALAGLGTPALAPKISMAKGLVIEACISFVLVSVVLLVTRKGNPTSGQAAVAIGVTLVALILFAGPLTGAGANPARYLGPALVARRLGEIAVYTLGPLLGAVASYVVYGLATNGEEEPVGAEAAAAERSDDEDDETDPFDDRPGDPESLLEEARDLFDAGKGRDAATLLLPLVTRLDTLGAGITARVRSLLLLIEDAHGPLDVLRPYRARLGFGSLPAGRA